MSADAPSVSDILYEAAQWLERQGMPLWGDNEVSLEGVRPDVEAGLFYLACCAG